ncbi:hypothetical protein ACHAPT_010850 [Fusarium lateritium]
MDQHVSTKVPTCEELEAHYSIVCPKEMSMNPKEITWPLDPNRTMTSRHLLQKYERAVQNLKEYIRGIDAIITDISAKKDLSAAWAALSVRFGVLKAKADRIIKALKVVLVKAKEAKKEDY